MTRRPDCVQRLCFLACISELQTKWPFLFTQKGLYSHFELLTDVSVLRTLELAMEECGRKIIEYFKVKSTNKDVKDVLKLSVDVDLSLVVLQLLMAHFSETITDLIITAQESTTNREIEETFPLPVAPRLILLVSGDTGGNCIRQWKISLEGRIICTGIQPTFITGLAAVFSTYYNFNLQYQEEAACTLEFIQRRFIGINPERGSKRARGESKKAGKKSVNPRVSTLLRRTLNGTLFSTFF